MKKKFLFLSIVFVFLVVNLNVFSMHPDTVIREKEFSTPSHLIVETEDMGVVHDYVDEGCLVVFDVDYTIACPQKDPVSGSVIFEKLLPIDHASEVVLSLQSRGISVIAHTNRPMAMSQSTIDQLKMMGIDFSINSVFSEEISLPSIRPLGFKKGMIFGNLSDKGEVFKLFLGVGRHTGMKRSEPKSIFF